MLQIQLEDLRQKAWQALYVGDRPRFATATSVRFLDAHTLVCASLLGRKIYLIRFDLGFSTYDVIDSLDTFQKGVRTETDLCDVDGIGNMITSNCEGGNMSLYRVANNKLCHDRDLITGLDSNYCHGARFCGPGVVAATVLRDPRGVHFYDVTTMQPRLYVKTDRLPKDLCFMPGSRAVVIMTEGAPLPGASTKRTTSMLELIRYDLRQGTSTLVAQQACDARQLDSVAFYEDRLYVADSHGGRVLVFEAGTLRQVDQINGFDFPHGVDARFGMLAVACYGTNSVHVQPLRLL